MPSEVRLAVCLYGLARGDYLHTEGELAGLGTANVCLIVKEVCHTDVASLWEKFVGKHMPKTFDAVRKKWKNLIKNANFSIALWQ